MRIEQLKIPHRDSAIISGHARRSLAEIPSRPVALVLQSLDKREKTFAGLVGLSWNLSPSKRLFEEVLRKSRKGKVFYGGNILGQFRPYISEMIVKILT